jgi:hypothetical protein
MKTSTLLLVSAALALSACSTKKSAPNHTSGATELNRYHVGGLTLSADVPDRRYPLHGGKFGK